MAHVPLVPIGAAREQAADPRTFDEQRQALGALESALDARRAGVHAGWGESYVARVHAKGKLTARERIARLITPAPPRSRSAPSSTTASCSATSSPHPPPASSPRSAASRVAGAW